MKTQVKWGNGLVVWLLTAALVIGFCGLAVAQDIDATTGESPGFEGTIIGLGAAAVPDYEGSDDYEGAPLPQIRWVSEQGYYLNLFGNTLRANIVPHKNFHFGPMFRYRAERDDDVEDERVKLLDEVDASSEVGAFFSYSGENWLTILSALTDVSDGHDGSLVELAVGYKIPLNKGLVTLFATTSYADSDYMDAYFSISPLESARTGFALAPFVADDSGIKDVGAGFAWQHFFNEKWGLLTLAKFTSLTGDAEDSPVVDVAGDSSQAQVGVIVNYRF